MVNIHVVVIVSPCVITLRLFFFYPVKLFTVHCTSLTSAAALLRLDSAFARSIPSTRSFAFYIFPGLNLSDIIPSPVTLLPSSTPIPSFFSLPSLISTRSASRKSFLNSHIFGIFTFAHSLAICRASGSTFRTLRRFLLISNHHISDLAAMPQHPIHTSSPFYRSVFPRPDVTLSRSPRCSVGFSDFAGPSDVSCFSI